MSIRVETRGARADVTIDRPDVLNALDADHQDELERAWRELEADERVRVAVLTGVGERAFCAGADMKAGGPDGLDYLRARCPTGFGGVSLRTASRPVVVARVNGHALGGGFEMVLGSDLAVAAEGASFGLPEALVGRVPLDGGVALIARALTPKLAREVLLAGRRLDAAEALELGLVNRVVAADELDDAVDALVDDLLAAAPLSQRAIRDLLAAGEGLRVEAAQALAPASLVAALASEDGVEGARAFREGRKPVWKGR